MLMMSHGCWPLAYMQRADFEKNGYNRMEGPWIRELTSSVKVIQQPYVCLLFQAFFFLLTKLQNLQDLSSPHPGIEPGPPTVEAESLNHWTTREFFPHLLVFINRIILQHRHTIHLPIISGYFCSMRAELSSCPQTIWPTSLKYLLTDPLNKSELTPVSWYLSLLCVYFRYVYTFLFFHSRLESVRPRIQIHPRTCPQFIFISSLISNLRALQIVRAQFLLNKPMYVFNFQQYYLKNMKIHFKCFITQTFC